MKADPMNDVRQTDKSIYRMDLICIQRLTSVFILSHESITKPAQPTKKEWNAFPIPANTKSQEAYSTFARERNLDLYNKQFGKQLKKLTSSVKDWFETTAYQVGWSQVQFNGCYNTGTVFGCQLGTA